MFFRLACFCAKQSADADACFVPLSNSHSQQRVSSSIKSWKDCDKTVAKDPIRDDLQNALQEAVIHREERALSGAQTKRASKDAREVCRPFARSKKHGIGGNGGNAVGAAGLERFGVNSLANCREANVLCSQHHRAILLLTRPLEKGIRCRI